jgi:hypothetical protein
LFVKKTMEIEHADAIGGVIVFPTAAAGKVAFESAMSSLSWGVRTLYPEYEYNQILKQIIPNEPRTAAEKAFVDLWDTGEFNEMVNILPSANILQNGGSKYDDGIIVGGFWGC